MKSRLWLFGCCTLLLAPPTWGADRVKLELVGEAGSGEWNCDGGIAVSGNYAYATDFYGTHCLRVINVADPTTPRRVAELNIGYAQDIAISGNLAFVAEGRPAGGPGLLAVVDVSVPAAPQLLGSTIGGMPRRVVATEMNAYVLDMYRGLVVFDTTSPLQPIMLAEFALTDSTYDIAVSGARAYIAAGPDGVFVIDVVNPTTLTLLATIN